MAHKSYGVNELREMFLSFFESKGHLRLPSFPLVPQHDKSILLINAGMTPMKPYFTGEEEPPRHRVCTCQKCIRTGDIDNIGKTARHGTYFEMLGNFSFGDYFKREALSWCWEFLTEVVGLEKDRLYPSIYQDDEEAFEIWNKEIGISADRIFRFGKGDNFWEHGSGPCGPCSEVYYDRGEEFGCGKPECTVGCDCDRYMEVWNNVFSQFNNDGHGNYTELVQKNIDTGMGLERLAVASQGVNSLFDVDTVMNITNKVTELTGASYGKSHKMDVSLRVITDHIRSATFLICDGVLPSNEGRGYVLRRLLRRAARHGKLLGVNKPFLFEVVATVVHENECQYPELREKESYITRVIKTEEENFCKTIDGGMKIFEEMLRQHKDKGETVFSGADAFKLYDTYGFPIDLTIEMAQEDGMSVDEEEFAKQMQEQKVRAREARKALGDLGWAGIEFGKEVPETAFVGYENEEAEGTVVAIISNEELCGSVSEGMDAIIVLDRTPMYAEMGGQIGDKGTLRADGTLFEVTDVQKNKGGKYMHYGKVVSGEISLGDKLTAKIDVERRNAIRRAHSATHLLQSALESVLGDHCHQAGSLVEPDRLRFDFTHFAAVTPEELAKINEAVTRYVLSGVGIETLVLPIEEAKKLGATALFGEKYGDTVRVVKMGDVSMEFCGGTHLDNTAKVGLFTITSEGSVASGVRRIEAVTGPEVLKRMEEQQALLLRLAETAKAPNVAELPHKLESLIAENKELHQRIDTMKDRAASGEIGKLLDGAKEVSGLKVVTSILRDVEAADLRKYGDILREKDDKAVACLASVCGEKISILAVCGKDAVSAGVKAGLLVKGICTLCGGSGGGKPDSAMGGAKDESKLPEALASVEAFVADNAK
ncbi:MAG: alanine--tRNA ligase [Clostridia bacterium]|nr:alanine--tRNA ligase [Clostridia bacterium]